MTVPDALRELAIRHGVELIYTDLSGQQREAQPEALLAVLRGLGAPLENVADAGTALSSWKQQEELVEPVLVAWEGKLTGFPLRLTAASARDARYSLRLEDGTEISGSLPVEQRANGLFGRIRELLPAGYHQLLIETASQQARSQVMAAPARAHPGRTAQGTRAWSAFLPLYAVRSARNQGIGDYRALGELIAWTGRLGGAYFGTLPLLATFLDQPFEPSPYSPASRLFWSDVFLDLTAVCGLLSTTAAAASAPPAELAASLERLNEGDLVDYREVGRLKRRALEPLARHFFENQGERNAQFQSFEREYPRVRDYAAFRAAGDRQQTGWPAWPERMRDGQLETTDYDAASFEYHLFAQYAATRQLAAVARQEGAQLYLDLPLGVHPAGYDVWRERGLFATGVSTGAPPDAFFTQGQNWGFPPINPTAQRAGGYAYLREAIRTHLRYAGALRLDHVMALHRVFWVPTGLPASAGVYVRYPAEELYALLCLESHRHNALIIGEDLGTVPPEVRARMSLHEIARMFVVQFEVQPQAAQPLPVPPAQAVASLNTHDMPTFEGFRRALDADLRGELSLIGPDEITDLRHHRRELIQTLVQQLERAGFLHVPAEPEQLRDALLAFLAASPARLLLVNLEDLWREERPQNVPGTSADRPNWRRRTRPTLEEIMNSAEITAVLRRLNEIRRES